MPNRKTPNPTKKSDSPKQEKSMTLCHALFLSPSCRGGSWAGEELRECDVRTSWENHTRSTTCSLASSQAPHPSLPFGKESSSIPLLLLSPQDPLRWAPAGDPFFPDLTGKEVRPEGCPTIEKDCRPNGRQSEETIFGNISAWRTGEHDVQPSGRTSFSPSFWGRGSGNQQPSERDGTQRPSPAERGRCRDG